MFLFLLIASATHPPLLDTFQHLSSRCSVIVFEAFARIPRIIAAVDYQDFFPG